MKDGTSHPGGMREDTALIRCSDVTFGYGGPPVLRDISFAISPGEIVTIVVPNCS